MNLPIDPTEANIVLLALRSRQRNYGEGSRGTDVCKAVADRLEAMILTTQPKPEE